jgi:hypothetical protein
MKYDLLLTVQLNSFARYLLKTVVITAYGSPIYEALRVSTAVSSYGVSPSVSSSLS